MGCATVHEPAIHDVQVAEAPKAPDARQKLEELPDGLAVPVDAVVLVDGRRLGPREGVLELKREGDRVVVGSSKATFKERAPWTSVRYVVQGQDVREYEGGVQTGTAQVVYRYQPAPLCSVFGLGLLGLAVWQGLDYRDVGERQKWQMMMKVGTCGAGGALCLVAGMVGRHRVVLPNGWMVRAAVSAATAQPSLAATYAW